MKKTITKFGLIVIISMGILAFLSANMKVVLLLACILYLWTELFPKKFSKEIKNSVENVLDNDKYKVKNQWGR